ncbi:hypothetical protein [Parasitella parasitica]|uniref:Cas12f1-like TNB domain-containing protein n=1 Tax=Parasitella parasitica TaxID=35722 RepID=A0A0B7NN46_9FUNG|nr:hypothetical protein [Parasitella parasitica]
MPSIVDLYNCFEDNESELKYWKEVVVMELDKNSLVQQQLEGSCRAAINSKKTLQVSNKMNRLRSDDLGKISTLIAATQKKIQDKTFEPLKFTDSRGSRIFSLLPLYDCKAKSIQIDQQALWKIIFDISKLGFKNKQDLNNDKRLFWNLMQTNGYSVEFIFKKKPVKKSTSKPLTAVDFCEDINNNQVLIWGVDPGVTDIYTAAGSGDASKKSIGEKKQTSTTDKWIPPKDKAADSSVKTRILAYGNASFVTSMKGKLPAPTKRITEAVKKLSKDSKGTYFIYVDEHLTSQKCNKCKQRKLTNLNAVGPKRKVHAVLKCNSCDTLWNRDVMASKNIYYTL